LELEPKLYDEFINWNMSHRLNEFIHNKLIDLYKEYLIVGGMPESLKIWKETKSFISVREYQKSLLIQYENDILKPKKNIGSGKLLKVFKNIVPP
jgi:predicted AAA+ superfamily ATPase